MTYNRILVVIMHTTTDLRLHQTNLPDNLKKGLTESGMEDFKFQDMARAFNTRTLPLPLSLSLSLSPLTCSTRS